jgi:hypothetical protein
MGVWGTGNLDSDGALDNFHDLVSPLVEQLAEVVANPTLAEADELSDWYMATVEVLSVLSQHFTIPDLTAQLVVSCRDTMLAQWESTIDELDPKPDYKAGRLVVMQQTFEKLLAGVRRWERSADSLNT